MEFLECAFISSPGNLLRVYLGIRVYLTFDCWRQALAPLNEQEQAGTVNEWAKKVKTKWIHKLNEHIVTMILAFGLLFITSTIEFKLFVISILVLKLTETCTHCVTVLKNNDLFRSVSKVLHFFSVQGTQVNDTEFRVNQLPLCIDWCVFRFIPCPFILTTVLVINTLPQPSLFGGLAKWTTRPADSS